MGNYIFGMITGLYCYYARTVKMPSECTKKIILAGVYLMVVISVVVVACHYFFYVNDYEKPSLWQAAFAMLTKNIWGLFGVFCTCAMVLKIESKEVKLSFFKEKVLIFFLVSQNSSLVSLKCAFFNHWDG